MLKNVLDTDLSGKVAVVTGAGGVLCSDMARLFGRESRRHQPDPVAGRPFQPPGHPGQRHSPPASLPPGRTNSSCITPTAPPPPAPAKFWPPPPWAASATAASWKARCCSSSTMPPPALSPASLCRWTAVSRPIPAYKTLRDPIFHPPRLACPGRGGFFCAQTKTVRKSVLFRTSQRGQFIPLNGLISGPFSGIILHDRCPNIPSGKVHFPE